MTSGAVVAATPRLHDRLVGGTDRLVGGTDRLVGGTDRTVRLPMRKAIESVADAGEPTAVIRDRRWIADLVGPETYLSALFGTMFRPGTFAMRWTAGARTIAPLKFVALSAAIVAFGGQIATPQRSPTPIWLDVVRGIAPSIVFALFGVIVHLVYRAAGSRRSIETSLGLTLYASAGPGVLLPAVIAVTSLVVRARGFSRFDDYFWSVPIIARVGIGALLIVTYLWPRIALGRAMQITHGKRRGWTILGIFTAEIAVSLAFGALQHFYPPSEAFFDWPHLVVWPAPHHGMLDLFW